MSMYSMLKTIIFSYIILYIPLYAYLMRYTTEKISSLSSNLEFDAMVKMVVDLLGERIILISTYSIVVGIFITLNLGILYYNLTGLKGGENNR